MNRIPEWNRENPSCIICGCKSLTFVKVNFKEATMPSCVCDQCRGIFVDRDEHMHFVGFLDKEQYLTMLTSPANATINMTPITVVDYRMN